MDKEPIEMTIEHLRQAVLERPFQAFTISLSDGRRFRVPSPEFIWIPPKAERRFYVAQATEEDHVIDLLHVTSLDYANGTATRRRSSDAGE